MEDAGRWALTRRPPPDRASRRPGRPRSSTSRARCCAATAWCSGGCWRARPTWLPPWRDLLRVYRRLEARGEIRGGRFVAGFSGEQYALPDAIGVLREVRRQPASGEWVSLSGADPLNLAGILTPGPRAGGADRQPAAVPRRPAGRLAGRRRGAVPGNARCAGAMGSPQGSAAFRHTGAAWPTWPEKLAPATDALRRRAPDRRIAWYSFGDAWQSSPPRRQPLAAIIGQCKLRRGRA